MSQEQIYLKFFKSDKPGMLRFECNSEQVIEKIIEKFTVPNPNYRFSRWANLTLCPITANHSFLSGLIYEISVKAKMIYSEIVLNFDNVKDVILPFTYTPLELEKVENSEKFKYYDYQEDAIRLGLRFGRGVLQLATSAGKSLIIYGLILNIWKQFERKCRILILVPNLQLVAQLKQDFLDYGCNENLICQFTSFAREFVDRPIVISNRQWLERHSDELPNDIEIVFIDELHSCKFSNRIKRFVQSIPTNSKFGLTATLPEGYIDSHSCIGLCGKILIIKKPKELQDLGRIANLKIITVKVNHKGIAQPDPPTHKEVTDKNGKVRKIELTLPQREQLRHSVEWAFIESSNKFNESLCRLVLKLENNTVLLFDHTIHGKFLFEYINSVNLGNEKEIYFINGETEVEIREDIRSRAETVNNMIIVANSKCFGTGINIKNLHNIVFSFTQGRSSVKIMQAIGRSLRILDLKHYATLYDFYHSFKYSTKHFLERLSLYKDNYRLEDIVHKELVI